MTAYKHRACPCGCGELADECMRPISPLQAFRITESEPPPAALPCRDCALGACTVDHAAVAS